MHGKCPFCGSPAAKWPDHASDYVKGYPLCEFHMGELLPLATVKKYTPEDRERIDRFNLIKEKLIAASKEIQRQMWDIELKMIENCQLTDRLPQYVEQHAVGALFPDIEGPVGKCIDDAEFDRVFATRVKTISNRAKDGKGLYRCAAAQEAKPDGRCTYYVHQKGDVCDLCKKKEVVLVGGIEAKKLEQILEIARNG